MIGLSSCSGSGAYYWRRAVPSLLQGRTNNTAHYQLMSGPVEQQGVMPGCYHAPPLPVPQSHSVPSMPSYVFGGRSGRGPASYVSQTTAAVHSRLGLFSYVDSTSVTCGLIIWRSLK